MAIDPETKKTQTTRRRKKAAAGSRRRASDRGVLLFHPRRAVRLETAMRQTRQELAAASQAAASAIEDTIALVADRPTLLSADQHTALMKALNRSLRALQAIDRLDAAANPVSAANQRILDDGVRLLLDAAERIARAS